MKSKLRLAAATVAVLCSTAALAGAAQASTYTDTVCAGVPSNASADVTVCLHAADYANGASVRNRWEWPQCVVEWYANWGYSCGTNVMYHYWNSQLHENTDSLHYVVGTALSFPGTVFGVRYCAALNINREPWGWQRQFTGRVYAIWPWQGC